MKESLKIALPKGRLLGETAGLLKGAGWGLDEYTRETRLYHLKSGTFPTLSAKMFNEKDIPVQVAVGNYDLGICGLDWVEEQTARYPSTAVVKVRALGYGAGALYLAGFHADDLDKAKRRTSNTRIASEYPNLAESFACRNRLRRFSIFPLWGAAEAYPPDSAELALISVADGVNFPNDVIPLARVLPYQAYLVANRQSWEMKDMSQILSSLGKMVDGRKTTSITTSSSTKSFGINEARLEKNVVRVALPDGHQQQPTTELLARAGIMMHDYTASGTNRRPISDSSGVIFKVIRPQDMPLQVAVGNFDLALTGRDWLRNHLYQFPSSPVFELVDLKYGWVRIVAVVNNEMDVTDRVGLRRYVGEIEEPFRIATEYVNIADKFARDNHLGGYRIIPTWGATEAFIPDDADLLIENTQTGRTLARHNLKIIDTLFESTACLIGRKGAKESAREARIQEIVALLSGAVEEVKI